MKISDHEFRLTVIGSIFGILLGILLWRMYDLTILHRKFLQGQSNARTIRIVEIPGYRGMITDRFGEVLAASAPVRSLWVNPTEFHPHPEALEQLAALINLPAEALERRLSEFENREFIWLKRQLTPELAHKIEELQIPGLNFQEEYKRFYPESESTAQVLGFTDIDDHGIEGLELLYNGWLSGQSGKKRVVRDRQGSVIEELALIRPPRHGHDLRLTLDRRIQYLAYTELTQVIDKFSAKSGSVIVLDSRTGEILAMVNAPSFNPNARERYTADNFRNKAITDVFEPGSVMKPFSIASALETGKLDVDTLIDTSPGWMYLKGRLIRDIRNYGVLDISGILQRSSNVGVTRLLLQNPPDLLVQELAAAGFGQRTDLALPGESAGFLPHVSDLKPFTYATLGFGYGLTVNALQLAHSYMIFANGGRLDSIDLIIRDDKSDKAESLSVITPETAEKVLAMLESVLDNTHRNARVDGYRVAGKTGTSRIAGRSGYSEDRHIASFAGIAPVSNPALIVVVVIHEPSEHGYYAGEVAAPLFAKIMGRSLHLLEVQPDAISTAENMS